MGRRSAIVRMRGLHFLLICILTMATTLIRRQEARPSHRRMDEVANLSRLVSDLLWEELLEERANIFNGLERRQGKMTKRLLTNSDQFRPIERRQGGKMAKRLLTNSRNYGVKGDLIPYPRTG